MTQTRYGAMARSSSAHRITGTGSGSIDGWEIVCTIPAAQLTNGHTYTLIVNGLLGDIEGARRDTVSDLYLELALGEGTPVGTYSAVGDFRFDPMQQIYWSRNSTSPPGTDWEHAGFPFQMIYEIASTGVDLHLLARIHGPGAARGTTWDCQAFCLDQVTMLAWDQTALTSTYYRKDSSSVYGAMPSTVTDKLSITGGGGTWLIYWSALVTAKQNDTSTGCGALVHSTLSPTYPFAECSKARWGGAQVDWSENRNRHWLGQQRMIGLGSSWTMTLKILDANSAVGSHWRSAMFAVLLQDDFDAFLVTASMTETGNGFFYYPFEGDYIYQAKALSSPYTPYAVFASITGGSGRTFLDVDSGDILRPTLECRLPVIPTSWSVGAHPFASGDYVDLSGEDHALLLRGDMVRSQWGRLTGFGTFSPTDPFVYGFHLVVDDDPPTQSFETPGPALDVVPERETGLDPGSLPELPYAPSMPITFETNPVVREIEFPSGYRVTHAKFLRMRRTATLKWNGLTVDQCDELVDFFRDLMADYGGAFQWAPPGDLSASAWTCDPYTWRRDGSNSFEVAVLELVFTAEP